MTVIRQMADRARAPPRKQVSRKHDTPPIPAPAGLADRRYRVIFSLRRNALSTTTIVVPVRDFCARALRRTSA